MSVMMPSVMMRRMQYWEPSRKFLAMLATWLTVGAKLVGPYSWMRWMLARYAFKTPERK
jgi:hypothetical protein